MWTEAPPTPGRAGYAIADMRDIARLLKVAIEGLSEPNAAAKTAAYHELQRAANAAAQLVSNGGRDAPEFLDDRQLRDCVAVILDAQLKGVSHE